MLLGVLHRQRLAGAQLAVNLQQSFLGVLGDILLDGGVNPLVVAEEIQQLGVGSQAQGPHENGDGQLAVFVDTDIEHIGGIGFIFQPGAPVGDDGGVEQLLAGGVVVHAEVHAGRTHQLGDDDSLRAVDDKGAAFRHQGEIAHKHFGFLDFAGFLIEQAGAHPQGGGVGDVPLLALLHSVFGFLVQAVIDEFQNQVPGIVGNGGHVVENVPEALLQKPLI